MSSPRARSRGSAAGTAGRATLIRECPLSDGPAPCRLADRTYNPALPSRRSKNLAPEVKSVAIIMGSQSDWQTMKHAAETLEALQVAFETRIVSAHRTPERLCAL